MYQGAHARLDLVPVLATEQVAAVVPSLRARLGAAQIEIDTVGPRLQAARCLDEARWVVTSQLHNLPRTHTRRADDAFRRLPADLQLAPRVCQDVRIMQHVVHVVHLAV